MATFISTDIRELLESEALRINNPSFIDLDPVQFPRRFSRLQDIEIVALLSAIIAWGKRTMICRNAEKMLTLMDYAPYHYVMDEGYEDLDDGINIHRTFFSQHFKYFLRGLHKIYRQYSSLDEMATKNDIGHRDFPAWEFVAELQNTMTSANNGNYCSQCLPTSLTTTALKRINMALRWLVRNDGIIDIGVWQSISPAKLFIPLDVHVGNTARNLGLITRKANDRKTVVELTETLRQLRPHDPVIYDFALFGIGIGI